MKDNMIQSVSRAISVIECFDCNAELNFNSICKKVNLSNGTVFRIINTFLNRGFIEKNENNKYVLGKKLIILGLQAFNNIEFVKVIHPILVKLANETKETCNAAIRVDDMFMYVVTIESTYTLKMTVKLGQLGFLHSSAAGKVLLAFNDEKSLSELLNKIELKKFNNNTITDKNKLLEEIQNIRKVGYSIDNEEEEIGAKCIGGPIFNNKNELVGSISISAPNSRFDKNFDKYVIELKKAYKKAFES